MPGGALNLDTALSYIAEAFETITGITPLPDASETRAGRIARIEHIAENATEITGGAGGSADWGDIGGTLSDQTDLQTALNAKQAVGSYLIAADLAPYALSATLAGYQPVGSYLVAADLAPYVLTATYTAGLATKEATGVAAGLIAALTKASVGLANVENTSDANKPVSTAQQTALDLKANLASPAFTGTPTGITATHVGLGNVTNVAQTSVTGLTGTQSVAAFKTGLGLVKADVGLGNVDNTADTAKPVSTAQQTALDLKANLAGPTFTGTTNFDQGRFSGRTWIGTTSFIGGATPMLGVKSTAADWAVQYEANTTVGSSFGLRLFAGTNASDYAVLIRNAGNTADLFTVKGDGTSVLTGTLNVTGGLQVGGSAVATLAALVAGYQPLDTQLTDLAALVYTANASKYVRVNAAANGFEVVTLAGGGDMLAANNLSDLASAATARTNLDVEQNIDPVKYDAAGAALGAAIADYFTTTISLDANSTYEIEAMAYFLKTTAGTVIWTWTFSSAPIFAQSFWQAGPITGFTTSIVNGTALFGHAVQEASLTLAHAASGSLTTAVRHAFMFSLRVRTNAATTVQLRCTESAGTLTPQPGSYMKARKIA